MSLETLTPNGTLALSASPGSVDLAEWVTRASSAHALMVGLVDSFFVPAAYKVGSGQNGREIAIANGVGAILLGQSIGVDPLTALQNIYVVHGRPGMYAKFKVALCQSRGHEIWTDERTDTTVTVSGRARGSERVHTITITMAMAEQAGWTSNAAYKKTPQDMLWARAAGRVSDLVGGGALFGMASIEDLEDGPDDRVRVITKVTAEDVQRRAGALPQATAVAPPEATEADAQPPADLGPAPEAASLAQTRKIYALLRSLGAGEKADGLAVISGLLEKPVGSTKELSIGDATALIDRLETLDRQPPDLRIAAVQFLLAGPGEPQHDELPKDGAEAEGDERA